MVVHSHYPWDPRVEREARALVDDGYVVDVICLRDAGEAARESVDGVSVHRVPMSRHRGRGAASQLLEYLAFFAAAMSLVATLHLRRRYGVVQVHNLPDFLVFAALPARATGARVLLDLHDLTPEFYASRTKRGMSHPIVRLVRLQERLSCRFADHVLTVTGIWRRALIDRGVPARKVSVVMNVADDALFVRAESRAPSGGPFRLLYHGTITYRYGVDVALRAVARVRERVPISLVVHGRGEYLDGAMALSSELGLDGIVRFSTASVPSRALPGLIADADVGLVPYRRDVFTDGILPTKLMEYAAMGTPAIASRTPAIERYFDDTMVRFVEPEDVDELAGAVLDLHERPEERQRLSQGILRFAEEHRWADVAGTYRGIVRRLHDAGQPAA